MIVTVAICTWNRAALLDKTLERMHRLHIPANVEWELLIVDNNSPDNTAEIIRRHSESLPIRALFELKQGLSHARNCAVADARGELILWTDDDVLVEERWLAEYVSAASSRPDVAFFGGTITPWFEGEAPQWLQLIWPNVSEAFATRVLGDQEFTFDKERIPFGANFAVRTEVQRRYPFNVALGRKGASLVGGEETAVIRQMMSDGFVGLWIPHASVRHFIPKIRQTLRFVRRFYYGFGETASIGADLDNSVRLFNRPRWLWRKAICSELRYRYRRMLTPPQSWIEDFKLAAFYWGWLARSATSSCALR